MMKPPINRHRRPDQKVQGDDRHSRSGMMSRLSQLARDERGSLLPAVAGSMLMLTGAAGLSIDGARMFYVKDVLQKSLDSAGLAAGHAMDVVNMENDAIEFFNANIASVGNLTDTTNMSITISEDNELITLDAEATVSATFMSLFGVTEVTVRASTEISRETRGMELVLVMDNTGSMARSGKITTMKEAATNLVHTVYGDDETNTNLWVGVVPYITQVNVGSAHYDWLSADGQTLVDTGFPGTEWMGCLAAREDGEDETDSPPSIAPFEPYYWADSDWEGWRVNQYWSWEYGFWDNDWIDQDNDNEPTIVEVNNFYSALGPNKGCGEQVTPLVAEKTTVLNAIDAMEPWSFGGTATPLGLAWGWRVISPEWRGLWNGSPSHLPMDHEAPFMDKVIVVLTDGQNYFIDRDYWPDEDFPGISDYTAYGRITDMGHTSTGDARDDLDDRFGRICSNIKADDIIIYSITFGSTPDSDTQTAFRNCATNTDFYFHAPTAASLEDAFETIGRQLSNLRLSK